MKKVFRLFVICAYVLSSLLPVTAEEERRDGAIELEDTVGADDLNNDGSVTLAATGTLPAQYDLRDEYGMPAVEDQKSSGLCWSFAFLNAVESNAIKNGYADTSINLSEAAIGKFTTNTAVDKLGLTEGDDFRFQDGAGNWYISGGIPMMGALTALKGVALKKEESAPLPTTSTYNETTFTSFSDADIVVTGYRYVPQTDLENIKLHIMEYGAGACNLYFETMVNDFWNAETAGYFVREKKGYNHSVTIVGWDDTYSKENFKDVPDGDGAWIIQNSWGENFGEHGYFYVSYYDQIFSIPNANYAVLFAETSTTESYNTIYQYDGTSAYPISKTNKKLPAGSSWKQNYTIEDDGVIHGVGFGLKTANTPYTIRVMKNDSVVYEESDVTYATGFYNHAFDHEIEVRSGDLISIEITAGDMEDVSWMVDITYKNSPFIATNVTDVNESLYRNSPNDEWIDAADEHVSARIKLYATGNHSIVHYDAKEESCEEQGWIEHYECEGCGRCFADDEGITELKKADVFIEAIGHSYTESERVQPTCTETGKVVEICEHCHDEKITILEALGHTTTVINEKEASCSEEGYSGDLYCSECESVVENGVVIEKSPHTTDVINNKEATCTVAGSTGTKYCRECGTIIEAATIIPPTGHSYVKKVVKATESKNGYTLHTCTRCGYSYKTNITYYVPKMCITSLKAGTKAFTVRWRKTSNVNGYQIRYSLYPSMKAYKTSTISKKTTVSKKVKNLKKKKKYYVQVRAYRIVNNKKYYGNWSGTKSIKTR